VGIKERRERGREKKKKRGEGREGREEKGKLCTIRSFHKSATVKK